MLDYIEPVFRPPSEWRSLILQITNGCSWNRCTFCEMYTQPQKRFNFKSLDSIRRECSQIAATGLVPQRIFLADGDAMTLSTRRLLEVLKVIREYFPKVQRISSYCLPRNLRNKSIDELKVLREYGLSLVYVGCESGDDTVLKKVCKGEIYASSLTSLQKLKAADIKTSIMILNGLGGRQYSRQHAIASAKLMNEAQPDYLSTLVVSFPLGEDRVIANFPEFELPSQRELFEEMFYFIEHLELNNTIFRSDHASNYLVLKGVLNRDKERLLSQIEQAIKAPDAVPLRAEWQRGL